MTSRKDLQINVSSEPQRGPGIPHITHLKEMREGFLHEQKSSTAPAGIKLMTLTTGGQWLTPKPPGPHSWQNTAQRNLPNTQSEQNRNIFAISPDRKKINLKFPNTKKKKIKGR
jgi:hypothetical protein